MPNNRNRILPASSRVDLSGTDGKILSALFMDAKPHSSQARISLKWFDSRKKSHMLEINSRNRAGRAQYRSFRWFRGNCVGISGQSVEETENKRFDQFTIRSDAHEGGARENSSICIRAP